MILLRFNIQIGPVINEEDLEGIFVTVPVPSPPNNPLFDKYEEELSKRYTIYLSLLIHQFLRFHSLYVCTEQILVAGMVRCFVVTVPWCMSITYINLQLQVHSYMTL